MTYRDEYMKILKKSNIIFSDITGEFDTISSLLEAASMTGAHDNCSTAATYSSFLAFQRTNKNRKIRMVMAVQKSFSSN